MHQKPIETERSSPDEAVFPNSECLCALRIPHSWPSNIEMSTCDEEAAFLQRTIIHIIILKSAIHGTTPVFHMKLITPNSKLQASLSDPRDIDFSYFTLCGCCHPISPWVCLVSLSSAIQQMLSIRLNLSPLEILHGPPKPKAKP